MSFPTENRRLKTESPEHGRQGGKMSRGAALGGSRECRPQRRQVRTRGPGEAPRLPFSSGGLIADLCREGAGPQPMRHGHGNQSGGTSAGPFPVAGPVSAGSHLLPMNLLKTSHLSLARVARCWEVLASWRGCSHRCGQGWGGRVSLLPRPSAGISTTHQAFGSKFRSKVEALLSRALKYFI